MRIHAALPPALALSLTIPLTACALEAPDDPATTDDARARPPATTIHIRTAQPFALVAYREHNDPVWHLASERTTGHFTARVRGPYWVLTACDASNDGVPNAQTWQAAFTLDDAHDLFAPLLCAGASPQPSPEVRGAMAQAGDVQIDGSGALSHTGAFAFALPVEKGTHTLYAHDDRHIAIRHAIDARRTVTIPTIDFAREGGDFVDVPFQVANADPAAEITAVTRIRQPTSATHVQLFRVPLPGKVVPDAVITDDVQTVSLQTEAFTVNTPDNGNQSRAETLAVRRPWRLGDDPTFVEPAQITGLTWTVDGAGQLVASWRSLPPATAYEAFLFGDSPSEGVLALLDISPAFLAATDLHSVTFASDVPGFQPQWRIDYTGQSGTGYVRGLTVQQVDNPSDPDGGTVRTSEISEDLLPSLLSRELAPARRVRPPHTTAVLVR